MRSEPQTDAKRPIDATIPETAEAMLESADSTIARTESTSDISRFQAAKTTDATAEITVAITENTIRMGCQSTNTTRPTEMTGCR